MHTTLLSLIKQEYIQISYIKQQLKHRAARQVSGCSACFREHAQLYTRHNAQCLLRRFACSGLHRKNFLSLRRTGGDRQQQRVCWKSAEGMQWPPALQKIPCSYGTDRCCHGFAHTCGTFNVHAALSLNTVLNTVCCPTCVMADFYGDKT